jgi:hypothetical protein
MITNFVLFQVGWFACVLGAVWGDYWLGPATAVIVLAVYLWQARCLRRAILLTVSIAMLGSLIDGFLTWMLVLRFDASPWTIGGLPLWMAALWVMFATTLDVSLRWLQRRPAIAGLLGAVAGPLAYVGAERLGAVRLGTDAVAWLALEWSVMMVVGTTLARSLHVAGDGEGGAGVGHDEEAQPSAVTPEEGSGCL